MTDEQNERAARVWREAFSAYAVEQEVIDGVVHFNMNKRNQAATAVIAREFEVLEAENARLREAMQWVANDPDLPKPFATYLRAALGASHDADA